MLASALLYQSCMTTEAEVFISQTDAILGVARRLSGQGIIIYAHECHCMFFGSWLVVAGKNGERFQFRWDGRDLAFTVSRGESIEGRREWQPIWTLNLRSQEAISGMEMFLHERFVA
jgi:hypothetical protein